MAGTTSATVARGSSDPLNGGTFHVHLDVYEGPFDLLLSLIAKRRLDVTAIALSQVTDEFIGYIKSRPDGWDLDQASGFLVVAATLLDLKVARLLPGVDVDDDEDLALLEARDLLLARLLQYRAYKQVAALFHDQLTAAARRYGRSVGLEPEFASLLPEVILGISPSRLAELAAHASRPRPVPVVDIGHVHAPVVSVREQAALLAQRLRGSAMHSFRALAGDCTSLAEVVGRFLALLELYREGQVAFDQAEPLAELHVRWVGGVESDDGAASVDEYDHTVTDEPA